MRILLFFHVLFNEQKKNYWMNLKLVLTSIVFRALSAHQRQTMKFIYFQLFALNRKLLIQCPIFFFTAIPHNPSNPSRGQSQKRCYANGIIFETSPKSSCTGSTITRLPWCADETKGKTLFNSYIHWNMPYRHYSHECESNAQLQIFKINRKWKQVSFGLMLIGYMLVNRFYFLGKYLSTIL